MARRTPVVQRGVLVIEGADRDTTIAVDTPAWFAWLANASTFRFACADGQFTARQERPSHGRGGRYWKAYRRWGGRLHRIYLGPSEALTLDQVRRTAAAFAEREQSGHATGLGALAQAAGGRLDSSVSAAVPPERSRPLRRDRANSDALYPMGIDGAQLDRRRDAAGNGP